MSPSRILVVDDEPGMLRAVERVLGDEHEVLTSRSGSDALSIAATLRPELAIVDVRMPDVDGFDLTAQLKARSPHLDIILMTGSVDDLDEKLIRAIRSRAFYFIQKPFDREVLRTLVERCLELRWRREQHRRHLQRLEREIEEARAFQRGMLPATEAVLNRVAICCRYEPFAGLGGDLYDYAQSAGRTAVLIADVSGHGVSAAMLTGIVKSAFHASHVDGYEPAEVVQRVWTGLTAFSAERFVTMVAAILAPVERRLRYVNAGHPAAALWSPNRDPLWLESTGPLVSPALAGSTWDTQTVPIEDGYQLLLYTDGVSDVLAASKGESEKRFRTLVARVPGGGTALLNAIVADVHHELVDRPQPDDLTLVTAKVLPSAGEPSA